MVQLLKFRPHVSCMVLFRPAAEISVTIRPPVAENNRPLLATSGPQFHCEHVRRPAQIIIDNNTIWHRPLFPVIAVSPRFGERASRSSLPADNEPAVSMQAWDKLL